MKTPINFPCVMFEIKDTIGIHLTEKNLLNKYAFIKNESDFDKMKLQFSEPIICYYYAVVNKAIEIEKLFN